MKKNNQTIAHISHASKVMLKILQARLQSYMNWELPDVQAGFRKGRGTRDLFKKIRDTKGTFHANLGTIKDRNGMDLTEAEEIKKSWQEYTEELYKKILTIQITKMVCTHLEPDILKCEVKWALGSIIAEKS